VFLTLLPVLFGLCMYLLENRMPINRVGEIAYEPATPPGDLWLQAHPPVCNRCWDAITPPEFWAGLRRALSSC
jgi:hypothetical protein